MVSGKPLTQNVCGGHSRSILICMAGSCLEEAVVGTRWDQRFIFIMKSFGDQIFLFLLNCSVTEIVTSGVQSFACHSLHWQEIISWWNDLKLVVKFLTFSYNHLLFNSAAHLLQHFVYLHAVSNANRPAEHLCTSSLLINCIAATSVTVPSLIWFT